MFELEVAGERLVEQRFLPCVEGDEFLLVDAERFAAD